MPQAPSARSQDLTPWLAEACRGAREMAEVTQVEVARLAGVQRSAIHRFETAAPWPKFPGRLVKAYAEATGMDDSRRLWRIAVGLWERYGHDAELPGKRPKPRDLAGSLDAYLQQKHEGEHEGGEERPAQPEKAVG